MANLLYGQVTDGSVSSGASEIYHQMQSGEDINWGQVAVRTLGGAVSGAVLGNVGSQTASGAKEIAKNAGKVFLANGGVSFAENLTYNLMGGEDLGTAAKQASLSALISGGTSAGFYALGQAAKNMCFVEGTMVLTAAGLVAIESIAVGDMVIATDPETGETAEKQVKNTFINETEELAHVFVDGEEIVCTPGHKFYAPERGWTSAIKLRAGDQLQLVNGEYVIIEAIQHELLEAPIKVYNFQVNDFHTYYVGTDTQVLVHNDCSTTFSSYYSYDELKRLVKESGLSAPGKGIEVHHLLEKQFADKVGVKSGDIISVPLVPRWHRGVKGEKIISEGLNIDNLIMNELKHITGQSNFQVAHDVATAEQIWQAHRNVYERIGQADWAEAVYEAYFKKMGIKYK